MENFHSLSLTPKFSMGWEPSARAKSKPVFVKGGSNIYENVNRNNGGISFAVQRGGFPWSGPG
jgi:hypothetical protein